MSELPKSNGWHMLMIIGLVGLFGLVAEVILAPVLTDTMLFHPFPGQNRDPGSAGMSFEEVWLEAEDGVRTQAWWLPQPEPATVVVHFHGNGGHLSGYLRVYRQIHALGVSVLAAEYRGYGDSEGSPSERGLFADGVAALAEARRRAAGQPVIVWGWSLGGSVAIHLAANEPVDGLVAESTFTNLADMADRSGIPFGRYLVAYEMDSLAKIPRVRAPVFLFHGDADGVVPYEMSERLEQAATGARWSTHRRVTGGRHDARAKGGAALWAELRGFVHDVVPAHRPEQSFK